ncbi:MAG: HpcH/HpaI aldolase family protein [Chloroflexota bacterium]
MRPNTAKRLLKEGKPAIGTWMNFASVGAAEVMAHAGWDWIVVDMEHGAIDLETMTSMFIAIGTTNTIPMCRVPWNDPMEIKRVLDAGSYGIVVPMVNSAEEARAAVSAAKYPPVGIRSAGGGRWRYWAGPDYMQYANEEILVVVQIEHIDAVRNVREILSVPGVDACFIGPNDLAWSMDLQFATGDARKAHEEAIQEVLRVAKEVGVPAGIHARSQEEVVTRIKQGFQYIACLNEGHFMFDGAAQAVKHIRENAGI